MKTANEFLEELKCFVNNRYIYHHNWSKGKLICKELKNIVKEIERFQAEQNNSKCDIDECVNNTIAPNLYCTDCANEMLITIETLDPPGFENALAVAIEQMQVNNKDDAANIAEQNNLRDSVVPYFEAWALLDENGEISKHEEERGIGIIYGLYFNTVLEVEKQLWANLDIPPKKGASVVNFKIININSCEGQRSDSAFQWDFLPYFEWDVIDIEYDSGEEKTNLRGNDE